MKIFSFTLPLAVGGLAAWLTMGSMSQSGQQPGDWRSHTSQRQNISSSRSHWSQKSSVMRHILAFCRRCQAFSDDSRAGGQGEDHVAAAGVDGLADELDLPFRRSRGRRVALVLQMSSTLTKSTPQEA